MSWNYRIVHYKNEDAYGLHEVFYNEAGKAWSMTEKPVGFVGDTRVEVLDSLSLAFADAAQRPVFEEPEQWAAPDDAMSKVEGPFHTLEEIMEALDVDETKPLPTS